jgi:hypothetical protein
VLAQRLGAIAGDLPRKGVKAMPLDQGKVEKVLGALQQRVGSDEGVAEVAGIVQGLPVPGLDAIRKKAGLTQDELRPYVQGLVQADAYHRMSNRRVGSVYRNLCPTEARLWDMLEGDEVADESERETTKVQFLLFTLAGLAAFGGIVWYAFMGAGHAFGKVAVPDLPPGFAELLGASGAGYVIAKVPTRTPRPKDP